MSARLCSIAVVLTLAPSVAFAGAHSLAVSMDEVKAVPLPSDAVTVLVGNPSIADASLAGEGLMAIQGRAPGRTNVLALRESGDTAASWSVVVGTGDSGDIRLYRGTQRITLSCTPVCGPVAQPGDEQETFNAVNNQIEARIKRALEAARSGQSDD